MAVGVAGCDIGGTSTEATDSGTPPETDSGTPPETDSGTPPETDAGTPATDAGTPATDAGTPTGTDAGTPAVTADWWVSPNGSDSNAGTRAAPFRTVTKAWSMVPANSSQTIMLRGGDYLIDSTLTLSGKNGIDADNRLKLFAYPGEVPQFHPTSTTSFSTTADRGISLSGNFLHVKGLEIYGFAQRQANCNKLPAGLHAQNLNNSILEELDIHHNVFGLAISSTSSGGHSTGNLILEGDFHHNSDPWSNTGGSCVMQDCPSCVAYGASDGLTIRVNSPSSTHTVRGCRMWMNSDDGVDLWNSAGMVIIENSWAFWNGFRPGATPGASDAFTEGGDGNGYKLGETSTFTTTVKRRLTNNLAFQNTMFGFNENNARCNVELYNNASYDNCYYDHDSLCGGYLFSLTDGIAYKLINNVSYGDVYAGADRPYFANNSSQADIHHNSWQMSGITSGDFFLSTAGVDGPRQADGSLPALTFLHLQAGSNLIDAGTSIAGFPMSCNGTCDVGAYEY